MTEFCLMPNINTFYISEQALDYIVVDIYVTLWRHISAFQKNVSFFPFYNIDKNQMFIMACVKVENL